jgi:hypothetical protein
VAQTYSKAYFERLDAQGDVVKRLEVQFNPPDLTLQKGAQIAEIAIPGIDSPILQFVRGQNERVTIELFFDSTAAGTGPLPNRLTSSTLW